MLYYTLTHHTGLKRLLKPFHLFHIYMWNKKSIWGGDGKPWKVIGWTIHQSNLPRPIRFDDWFVICAASEACSYRHLNRILHFISFIIQLHPVDFKKPPEQHQAWWQREVASVWNYPLIWVHNILTRCLFDSTFNISLHQRKSRVCCCVGR